MPAEDGTPPMLPFERKLVLTIEVIVICLALIALKFFV